MRLLFIALALSLFAVTVSAQKIRDSKTSGLPEGTLTGNLYTNDALGVKYEILDGWKAEIAPKDTDTELDPGHPDGVANRCSRILVSISPSQKQEGRFSAIAAVIAIDPVCIDAKVGFPRSIEDREQASVVGDKIIKFYKRAPFFSPYGVEAYGGLLKGHVILHLDGRTVINAIEGHPAPAKEPLNVRTSFAVAESRGYWVAFAHLADEPSAEALNHARIVFSDNATPQPSVP